MTAPAQPPTPPAGEPLIALDWGTSNLRAFLIDPAGKVIEERHRPWGILRLPEAADGTVAGPAAARYQAALAGIAGDWMARWPQARLLACGMVGSRNGWREAPYLAVPAEPADLARARIEIDVELDIAAGRTLAILPGLCQGRSEAAGPDRPFDSPDVMRGEETQAVGALARDPRLAAGSWLIMPGTHSKWVRIGDGRLLGFTTHMTGEMFDVLGRHSILAQSLVGASAAAATLDDNADEAQGFDAGVRLAAEGDTSLQNLLFGIRGRTLLRHGSPDSARGLLSGILIGHEVTLAAIGYRQATAPLVLVGEPALVERYRRALAIAGLGAPTVMDNTAADGLHRIGQSLRELR